MAYSAAEYPTNLPIPVDLFVSKIHTGLTRGDLGFADTSGRIVFKVNRQSSKSSANKLEIVDATGKPVISLHRSDNGSWKGYKGDDQKDSIFTVRTEKTELLVSLVNPASELKVKGQPSMKSCTIYKGNDIVAQTSLMYKLCQLYVSRRKFRLTIFPGSVDHAVVAALIVIFFERRRK
ncbi:protein LURP-one-related 7-like [Juglans microcarpa x Juglans regia]|uniref:protein LURP-one-related 7-like n=1 Tax=Juglans microcarpa x Juglans regia TaxID=2249226 RepID=UPI001B7E3D99|nr:protein LURP-one-related 7-like [Juglans microcarpa x Juglans regia]